MKSAEMWILSKYYQKIGATAALLLITTSLWLLNRIATNADDRQGVVISLISETRETSWEFNTTNIFGSTWAIKSANLHNWLTKKYTNIETFILNLLSKTNNNYNGSFQTVPNINKVERFPNIGITQLRMNVLVRFLFM